MIKIRNLVPNVYYQHSRDFQLIGRLYELALTAVKTNSDLLYNLPNNENSDVLFLDLLSTTLGFKTLHNYNVNQLKALCSCFIEIIRNKGNITSIEKACNALISAEGITKTIYIDTSNTKKGLVLYVPQELSDITLLRDLLEYVLPAGCTYTIVKTLNISHSIETTVPITDEVNIIVHGAGRTSQIKNTYSLREVSMSGSFDASSTLINSTIVDTYLHEIHCTTSMKISAAQTIEMNYGTITFNKQIAKVEDIVECYTIEDIVGGSSETPEIYFKLSTETYGSMWTKVDTVGALGDKKYYLTHDSNSNIWTIKFKMPDADVEVTANLTMPASNDLV